MARVNESENPAGAGFNGERRKCDRSGFSVSATGRPKGRWDLEVKVKPNVLTVGLKSPNPSPDFMGDAYVVQ